MSQLTQALERILKMREKIYPPAVTNLNPGLTRTEIKTITAYWLIKLPTEIYELYQWRNGVGGGSKTYEPGGLFERWAFEPLQNISIEKQPSPYEYPLDRGHRTQKGFLYVKKLDESLEALSGNAFSPMLFTTFIHRVAKNIF
jgi:hypothetical protein